MLLFGKIFAIKIKQKIVLTRQGSEDLYPGQKQTIGKKQRQRKLLV